MGISFNQIEKRKIIQANFGNQTFIHCKKDDILIPAVIFLLEGKLF